MAVALLVHGRSVPSLDGLTTEVNGGESNGIAEVDGLSLGS